MGALFFALLVAYATMSTPPACTVPRSDSADQPAADTPIVVIKGANKGLKSLLTSDSRGTIGRFSIRHLAKSNSEKVRFWDLYD